MLIVQATRQPILSLPDVRLLMNVPKTEFDAAILKLRDAGRARLHGHDHPFGIDTHRRDELVAENGERFYVGISPVEN